MLLKADRLTKIANVFQDLKIKCLIPKEFGGGYITGYYDIWDNSLKDDKGLFVEPAYSLYEIVAIWNQENESKQGNGYDVATSPTRNRSKRQDRMTPRYNTWISQNNIYIGKNLYSSDEKIDTLKYPLKLVSLSYRGSYESCKGKSFLDPKKGTVLYRKDMKNIF